MTGRATEGHEVPSCYCCYICAWPIFKFSQGQELYCNQYQKLIIVKCKWKGTTNRLISIHTLLSPVIKQRVFVPLMLFLERDDLIHFLLLPADLGFLPVDDLPVLAKLVLPARTLVLETL